MPIRAGRMRAAGLVLFALLALAACSPEAAPARSGLPERTVVTVGDDRVDAEIARTPAEQAQGLSGRAPLAPGTGMLFPYTTPRRLSFWMKDMRFDLDIVWIRDGRIVDLSEQVPAPRTDATALDVIPEVAPREPVDAVLEVVAGTAEARGWRIGDRVSFDPPPLP